MVEETGDPDTTGSRALLLGITFLGLGIVSLFLLQQRTTMQYGMGSNAAPRVQLFWLVFGNYPAAILFTVLGGFFLYRHHTNRSSSPSTSSSPGLPADPSRGSFTEWMPWFRPGRTLRNLLVGGIVLVTVWPALLFVVDYLLHRARFADHTATSFTGWAPLFRSGATIRNLVLGLVCLILYPVGIALLASYLLTRFRVHRYGIRDEADDTLPRNDSPTQPTSSVEESSEETVSQDGGHRTTSTASPETNDHEQEGSKADAIRVLGSILALIVFVAVLVTQFPALSGAGYTGYGTEGAAMIAGIKDVLGAIVQATIAAFIVGLPFRFWARTIAE